MADWELNLDQFLVNEDLPVLSSSGSVSHEEAKRWAEAQYDAFAERRRVEAEARAEEKYLDDLAAAARLIEGQMEKPLASQKTSRTKKA